MNENDGPIQYDACVWAELGLEKVGPDQQGTLRFLLRSRLVDLSFVHSFNCHDQLVGTLGSIPKKKKNVTCNGRATVYDPTHVRQLRYGSSHARLPFHLADPTNVFSS
jgi:hypothetical protein